SRWSLNYSNYLMTRNYALNDSRWSLNYSAETLSLPNNLAVAKNLSVDTDTLFIDSVSGNVGIGTTAPISKLTLSGSGNLDASTAVFSIINDGTINATTKINFVANDADAASTFAGISAVVHGSGSGGQIGRLGFFTKATVAAESLSERLSILSDGRVGIGTTEPGAPLEVIGTNGIYVRNIISEATYGKYFAGTAGGGYDAVNPSPGYGHHFFINGSEKVRITDGGNVGIGTNESARKLHVKGDGATTGSVLVDSGFLEVDGVNTYSNVSGGTENLRIGWPTSSRVAFNVEGTEVMTMLPSGRVGIGTTEPGAKLHVKESSGDTKLTIQQGDTSSAGILNLYGGREWHLKATRSGVTPASAFVIRDASLGEDRFTIDINGNVGIGTASPTQKLDVAGSLNLSTGGGIYSPVGTLRDGNGGWIRTYGNTGWYSQTYAGGWYMTDTSYIRNYNSKPLYIAGTGNIFDGSLSVGGLSTFYSLSGAGISYGGQGGTQFYGAGSGAAMLTFHRPGAYAINFGLDTNNQLSVGGWSMGANTYKVWHAANDGTGSGLDADLLDGYSSETWVQKAGDTMSGNLNFNNYGLGVVGVYSASRYQGVFAMGNSYKLSADGTTPGTLYGIAWTHENVGGQSIAGLSHQALFMANGVTQTAIGTGIYTKGKVYVAGGGSDSGYSGAIWTNTGSPYTTSLAGYTLSFNTGANAARTSRMYIDNSGYVGIAMTNPSVALDVTGNIEYTGTITDVSDARLKENIIAINSSLEKIMKLNSISFNMINDSRTNLGFTAQNVQTVFPEAVSIIDPEGGYLGLDYTQLISPTIRAIQEQQLQIESLKKIVCADHPEESICLKGKR
ncbi:MAG: tail fiber domain-containing protein, partial [Dehalococcoidales bacterium]|nr:tail fiber domain-containing protein [Dehalococcoidales bacterium]